MEATQSAVTPARPLDRLDRYPFVLPLIVALMWLTVAAESQTVLPLLGALEKEYGLTAAQGAWTLSITGVVSAAVVCALSRCADIFGLRKVLLISLVTIVVGNVLSAIAPGSTLFLIGRGVIGFTAATPLLLTIFRYRSLTATHLDRHLGIMSSSQGSGLVLSFVLGGLVIHFGGTARVAVWLIAVLAMVLLALVFWFVPDSPTRTNVRIDVLGAVLIGLGLALVVVGLGKGNTWGWGAGTTWGVLGGGVVALLAWGLWELRARSPMVDLRIVARRSIWPAFLASAIAAMLGTSNSLVVAQYVETPSQVGYGFGASVLVAGLYLVPVGAIILVGGGLMEPVIRRIGQRNSCLVGGVLAAAVFFWFSENHAHTWQFVVELVVFGAAFVLTSTAANSAYMRGARLGESGMIAGAANVVAIALQSLGPTIAIAILTSSTIPHTPVPRAGNYGTAWLIFGIFGLAVVAVSALIRDSKIDPSLAPNTEIVGTARAVGAEAVAP